MDTIYPLTIKIMQDRRSKDAPFVAYNPEIDVASCGPSEEKARKNLFQAIQIVVKEVKRKGKLVEFLKELGFQQNRKRWIPPRVSFEPFYLPTL